MLAAHLKGSFKSAVGRALLERDLRRVAVLGERSLF